MPRLITSVLGVLLVVAVAAVLGLALGSRPLGVGEVLAALLGRDAGDASIIVLEQRLPRTLLGLLVGAALGMGGAVAQSLTRNPLADPGLPGVSAGAALAIVSRGVSDGALRALRGHRHGSPPWSGLPRLDLNQKPCD